MKDNKDEGPLDYPPNTQSKNSLDDFIPEKDAEAINPHQKIENMGLHHQEKKSWRSYFWEFLMLFLAVFCGFLAENQRESLTEQRQEEEYIISFIKDVELDIASLKQSLVARKRYVPTMIHWCIC